MNDRNPELAAEAAAMAPFGITETVTTVGFVNNEGRLVDVDSAEAEGLSEGAIFVQSDEDTITD